MWFKHRKEYSEAYLELKKGRVLEKEKVRREELGGSQDAESSPKNIKEDRRESFSSPEVTRSESDHSDKETLEIDEETNKGTYEQAEDDRQVPQPKGKKKWLILLFWLLFVLSAMPVFLPFVRRVLSEPVAYDLSMPSVGWLSTLGREQEEASGEDSEGSVEEPDTVRPSVTDDIEAATDMVEQVTGHIQETAPDVIEGAQSMMSQAQEELRQDDLRSYARVHRIVLENAQHIRNTTQRYVTRKGHYVEMRALEGRINTEMSRARLALQPTEQTSLHDNLIQRIERTEALRDEVKEWDRSTAPDAVNDFIRKENADVDVFIRLLEEALEAEGRSYTLEDDIFRFD